ncbi:MAG: phosphodiester glycosidase family protein [Actinomycetota bacterium]
MPLPRAILATLISVTVLAGVGTVPSSAADTWGSTTFEVDRVQIGGSGSGVRFSRILQRLNGRNVRAFVLEIAPFGNPARIDVGAGGTKLPISQKLSTMGLAHGAIASINADFGIKRPDHVFIEDGKVWSSGLRNGGTIFGVRKDETRAFIDRPKTAIDLHVGAKVRPIEAWNAAKPGAGEITAYSFEGGNPSPPPGNACSVLLRDPTAPAWTTNQRQIKRRYTVEARRCGSAMASPSGAKVVLASKQRGAGARVLKGLSAGNRVTLQWGTSARGAIDVVGGRQQLLEAGALGQVTCDPDVNRDLCSANPRSGAVVNRACAQGPASECRVFLVVVDGRQGEWSSGFTLKQFGTFLRRTRFDHSGDAARKTWNAINFDGGGSAEMWLKKVSGVTSSMCGSSRANLNTSGWCTANRPSTNGSVLEERGSENAVLVKTGTDSHPNPEPGGL